jgi:3-deoxy-7-phosphoheptulonate synthase
LRLTFRPPPSKLVPCVARPVIKLSRPGASMPDKRVSIEIRGSRIGGGPFGLIGAAPRGLPSEVRLKIAQKLAHNGATMLHDGSASQMNPVFEPHAERLELLAEMRRLTGLPVVGGLMDPAQLEGLIDVVDVVQVGAFQMQNYTLLKELGRIDRAVLLRRGAANTIDELLSAAEYVLSGGNDRVMLCERGIRTFERAYEATLDFAAIPILKERSTLPVLVDPSVARNESHREALSVAAAACGADGIVVELARNVGPFCEHVLRAATASFETRGPVKRSGIR